MNIAFVGAHHDDLELSCGGSIAAWAENGHKVYGIILTKSQWTTPNGKLMGDFSKMCQEAERASNILGYEPLNLGLSDDFDLKFMNFKSKSSLRPKFNGSYPRILEALSAS